MKIAVLGCGPAGLMAACGAADASLDHEGGEITIFSRKVKSDLYGAQFLHRPIPGVTPDTNTTVEYRIQGSPADYRRKVYGQMWKGAVSPEDLEGTHQAWDIRATYGRLWEVFEPAIVDVELDPVGLTELLENTDFDMVINSVPLDRLCYSGHEFGHVNIIAAGDAPDRGIDVGKVFRTMDDTVICNGNESPGWYRMSKIFGHTTVEWPASVGWVPISTASVVRKPTHNDCDCWPTIFNVGRYGTWTKGVLSHTAYFSAYDEAEKTIALRSA